MNREHLFFSKDEKPGFLQICKTANTCLERELSYLNHDYEIIGHGNTTGIKYHPANTQSGCVRSKILSGKSNLETSGIKSYPVTSNENIIRIYPVENICWIHPVKKT